MMLTGDLHTRIDTKPCSEPCWGKNISNSMSRRHGPRKSSSCWRTCSDWWLDRGQFLESAEQEFHSDQLSLAIPGPDVPSLAIRCGRRNAVNLGRCTGCTWIAPPLPFPPGARRVAVEPD